MHTSAGLREPSRDARPHFKLPSQGPGGSAVGVEPTDSEIASLAMISFHLHLAQHQIQAIVQSVHSFPVGAGDQDRGGCHLHINTHILDLPQQVLKGMEDMADLYGTPLANGQGAEQELPTNTETHTPSTWNLH